MIIRIWPMMPTTTTASQAQRGACGLASLPHMNRTNQPQKPPGAEPAPPRRTADQSLEDRAAGQQRRRQRQPQEDQPQHGPGEGVVTLPPGRLLLRWVLLRWRFFRRLRGICHERRLAVREVRRAFLGEGVHTFCLVGGGKR